MDAVRRSRKARTMRYTAFNRHGRQVTVTVPSDQAKASAPIDPITWWGEKGLEYWETGGGCVAFGRNLEDEGNHYVLVTTQDGDAPPVAGESVLVGLYNPMICLMVCTIALTPLTKP